MITVRTSDSASLMIVMYMTSPSIYLDYCVIANFAESPVLGNRFRDILFQTNGTICLSLVHLMEVSGLGLGPTYSEIKSFLCSLENKFVVLDFNPDAVIERERAGNNFPALEPELTKAIIEHWDGLSPLSFSILLNGLQKFPQFQSEWKQIQAKQKSAFKKMFDDARVEFKNNSSVKNNLLNSDCPDPRIHGTTEYVYCQLRRECIKTNDNFNPSDGPDFFHSVVAFSHTGFVVLDKKWARRLRAIQVPTKCAKIFATNEYNLFFNAVTT